MNTGAHVVVVGAGAIGSHVLPHVARLSGLARLTIVDRDRYEEANLPGQAIDVSCVGRPKAVAQARRLRRAHPTLDVRPIHGAVEDVPLGTLRADVILGCLDSVSARMTVGQAAWRLGVPFVDAGVQPAMLLARVSVFVPGSAAPCFECGMDASAYASIGQRYPCQGPAAPAPTRAPAALSALAAAVQAIECQKILTGESDQALVGREVLIDVRHHTHYVSALRQNPACRMPDHPGWRIEPFEGVAAQTTLGEVLAQGSTLLAAGDRLALGVAGQRFATALACVGCGVDRATFQLERALRRSSRRCPACGGRLRVAGFALHDAVEVGEVPARALDLPLPAIGLRVGDVFSLSTPAVDVHFELR